MGSLANAEHTELINRMFEITANERELTIVPEVSHKGYTAYHFKYDFGVSKYEAFIIVWDEENSGGADENNYKELMEEIEAIQSKAEGIRR